MGESRQHTLDRVRAPRVQITYDVEIGDATEQKELPFVVGVLGDYSGNPKEELPKLKNRGFVEVDRDNFNKVLDGTKPRLTYRVPNKIAGDDSQIGVELEFKSIDDFEPQKVARQVKPLGKLLDIRQKLTELLTKMDGNDDLVDALSEIIQDTEKVQSLASPSEDDSKGGSE